MDRRRFLRSLVGGVAVTAVATREWPFRVYSFPGEVVAAPGVAHLEFYGHYLPDLVWVDPRMYRKLLRSGVLSDTTLLKYRHALPPDSPLWDFAPDS